MQDKPDLTKADNSDHVHQNKRRTAVATFWSLLGNGFQQVAGLVVFIFLARLLAPSDFGIVGVAFVVIEILNMVSRLGLLEVLQQRADLTESEKSTAFWCLQATGLLIFAFLMITAPFFAREFALPELANVLMLCAPISLIQNLGTVHEAMIKRGFGFKWLAARTAVATLGGAFTAVALALYGFGLYALVMQRLVTLVIIVVMVWWSYRWVPARSFSLREAKSMIVTGGHIASASLMGFLNPRILDVVVGYTLGATAVGILRIASRIFDFVTQMTIQPVLGVAFVSFNQMRGDPMAIGASFCRLIQISTMMLLPVFLGLGLVADSLVPLLFGEQWHGVVVPFQLIAILSFAAPLNFFFAPTMIAMDRSSTVVIQAGVQVALTIALTVAAVPYGLTIVLIAHVLRAYLMAVINLVMLHKVIKLDLFAFFFGILPPAVAGVAMTGVVLLQQNLLSTYPVSTVLAIAISGVVGAIIYTVTLVAGDYLRLWPNYIRDLLTAGRSMMRKPPAAAGK